MQLKLDIGKRLKELRKKNKFSQQFVAENLFISQAAYSLIENSQNGIVAEHIVGLSNLYEVTTDFLLKGDNHLIRISASGGFIPYLKRSAQAGYIKNKSGALENDEYEWCRIPGYNPTQDHMLFEVEGISMVPTVLPGDVVICQKQKNWDSIPDGALVLLITQESILLKRLKMSEGENEFLFESDNPEDAEDVKIGYSEIKEIMMVRGKISNVLFPSHDITPGRIQVLEKAIDSLKKELHSSNK